MANPQVEDGYTRINNETMEALCRTALAPSEWSVVLFVLRRTWGWHKKQDKISLTQFEEATHLSRKYVCRALEKTVARRILFVEKSGGGRSKTNVYRFNKDHSQWLNSCPDATPYKQLPKIAKQLPLGNPKTVAFRQPTKETVKESNNTNVLLLTKKKGNELSELLDYAQEMHFVLQGTVGDNRKFANLLLEKHGLANTKKLVLAAVKARGQPYSPTINDFTQLHKKAGDLAGFYRRTKQKRKVVSI